MEKFFKKCRKKSSKNNKEQNQNALLRNNCEQEWKVEPKLKCLKGSETYGGMIGLTNMNVLKPGNVWLWGMKVQINNGQWVLLFTLFRCLHLCYTNKTALEQLFVSIVLLNGKGPSAPLNSPIHEELPLLCMLQASVVWSHATLCSGGVYHLKKKSNHFSCLIINELLINVLVR